MKIRLQKILSQAGVASRRAAEEMIRQGRVTVNGEVVTEMGSGADPDTDRIRVDGNPVVPAARKVYLLLNKPAGCVTTFRDPQGRKTVFDFIPEAGERVFPVGRLDYDAEGLLILTNDGYLANRLQHPRYGVSKVYEVKVAGTPDERALGKLRNGVRLKEGVTSPAEVEIIGCLPNSCWLRITIHQGWYRQIKRMGEAVGHPVQKIKRIAYGPLVLGNVKPGASRALSQQEVRALYRVANVNPRNPEPRS